MRNVLAAFFNFILKTIAFLFAILVVVATFLVLLLLGIQHVLLNSSTYKRALSENRVYERLPALVGEQMDLLDEFLADPCAGNPLACVIEGASPELRTCLTDALGAEAYEQIGSGQRSATESELSAAQPCLDRFGEPASQPGPADGSAGENPPGGVGGPPAFLNNLSAPQWESLIRTLLPPDELQQMTESALDGLFAYANGKTDTATVPLVSLKKHLTGQAGRELILFLVGAQPTCTEEENSRILAGNFGGEGEPAVMCNASGEALDKLLAELQRQMDEAAAGIPDVAVLVKPPSPSEPSNWNGPLGNDPQTILGRVHAGILLSPLLPLALLLVVTLFGVRSLRDWLGWWGIPLLIAGLIVLAVGIVILPSFEWAWMRYAVPKVPAMFAGSSLVPLAQSLAHSIADDLSVWITIEAGIVAVIGLGAVIASFFVKPKEPQALPQEEAPQIEESNVS